MLGRCHDATSQVSRNPNGRSRVVARPATAAERGQKRRCAHYTRRRHLLLPRRAALTALRTQLLRESPRAKEAARQLLFCAVVAPPRSWANTALFVSLGWAHRHHRHHRLAPPPVARRVSPPRSSVVAIGLVVIVIGGAARARRVGGGGEIATERDGVGRDGKVARASGRPVAEMIRCHDIRSECLNNYE